MTADPETGISNGAGSRGRVLFFATSFALFAFAVTVRLPSVREGIWRDEALGAFIAQSPSLDVFFERSRTSDYNPPLFNSLTAIWGAVAGFGERSMKIFALVWGIAAIAGVGVLARQLYGSTAGLIAALIAANNPILLELSAELRPYSFSVFLAMLALTLLVRLRARPPARYLDVRWILFAVCLTLLAFSHMAGVFVVAVLGIIGLLMSIDPAKRRFGLGVAGSAALAGLAYMPWAPTSLRQARVGLPWEVDLSAAARLNMLRGRMHDVVPPGGALTAVIAAILIGLAVSATRRTIRDRLRAEGFGYALAAACALSVLLVLGLYSPSPRYLAIPAALFAVILGGFLGTVWDSVRPGPRAIRVLGMAGVGLFLAGSVSARIPQYLETFERDRAALPKSGLRPLCRAWDLTLDDVVLVAPDYLALSVWYYCRPRMPLRGFVRWDNPHLFDPRGYPTMWASPVAVPETLERLKGVLEAGGAKRFTLVWDTWSDGPPLFYLRRINELRRALAKNYTVTQSAYYVGRVERVGLEKYAVATGAAGGR